MTTRMTTILVAFVAAFAGVGATAAVTQINTEDTQQPMPGSAESSSPSAPTTSSSLDELIAAAVVADASSGTCQTVQNAMRTATTKANRQRSAASAVTDLRGSARFVGLHPWAIDKPSHGRALQRKVRGLVNTRADTATGARTTVGRKTYASALLEECNLAETVEIAEQSTRAADTAIDKLQDRAIRAPWWPVEYTKLNGDVAWKPFTPSEYDSAPCDISQSACLKGRVVSRVRCQSVYLEANIYDTQHQLIDWSNDSLGVLDVGETGIVEFVSFTEDHPLWRVTNVACN
jgi:hypothetical protein